MQATQCAQDPYDVCGENSTPVFSRTCDEFFSLVWGKGEKQKEEWARFERAFLRIHVSHGSHSSIHKMSRRSTTSGNQNKSRLRSRRTS